MHWRNGTKYQSDIDNKLLIMEYQSEKLIQIMEENIKPENKCIKE